jgi:hypothetical protein
MKILPTLQAAMRMMLIIVVAVAQAKIKPTRTLINKNNGNLRTNSMSRVLP